MAFRYGTVAIPSCTTAVHCVAREEPTVVVLEDAVLVDDVGADQLDVLGQVGLGGPNSGGANLRANISIISG